MQAKGHSRFHQGRGIFLEREQGKACQDSLGYFYIPTGFRADLNRSTAPKKAQRQAGQPSHQASSLILPGLPQLTKTSVYGPGKQSFPFFTATRSLGGLDPPREALETSWSILHGLP